MRLNGTKAADQLHGAAQNDGGGEVGGWQPGRVGVEGVAGLPGSLETAVKPAP
jgi:hypothetical protein